MKRLTLVLATAVISTGMLLPSSAAAATGRQPDLGMAPLTDFQVDGTSGRLLLRFSTTVVNVGEAPFELRGRRSSTSVANMTVKQRVLMADGTKTWRATAASMFYAGDGHDHWHVRELERYTIHPLNSDTELGRGAKVGYCFFDTATYRLSLPRAPQSPVYQSCGAANATTVIMGLSVGWGDLYPWYLSGQWIDITDLAPGDYIVRARADPHAYFAEASTANNGTWTKIRIDTADNVTVLAQGPAA